MGPGGRLNVALPLNVFVGLVGCVLGSDSEIGPDCRAESGALLPAESKVEPGSRIKKG